MTAPYRTSPGVRYPPGAKPEADGVNFSVFSRHATQVELLLFEQADSPEPFQVIVLQAEVNRTFFAWHVYVEALPVGTWYAWRMDGPSDTRESGLRFDKDKLLLDPWSRVVSDRLWDRRAAQRPGDNSRCSMRGMVVDESYDWEGDAPLAVANENAVIYELHVGGFTRHPSSAVDESGSFKGLMEKIPYLESLGITHVELMPVMAFDVQDVPESTADLGLSNYWGYSTHSFFAPHPGYCVTSEQGTQLQEFRDLVKALHRAGIGVILDVVFNHTAEGGAGGPIISFKGIDNNVFYHLDSYDKTVFRDYTGCGNTVNCNHPVVTNFIISCLEYWVREIHVDGFRFDLASALARGEDGEPLHDAPVLWGIELSDQLSRNRLIAEAWDAAGLYQVGSFPGYRWAEWNGRYRDVIRRCLRGEKGLISELATRMSGSSDFYKPQHRLPINSINFITCHDGFTLWDLFSYNEKHNQANGEDNRDGHKENLSFNHGVEGETDDPEILARRRQQAKNAIAILLLSQGVPMLLAGDEVLNTQAGNNNSYCQDNEMSWFDWSLVATNADMLRFVRLMIALRKRHPCLMRRRFLTGLQLEARGMRDVSWHGKELDAPLWHDPEAQVLAFTLAAVSDDEADLHVMLNLSETGLDMELPSIPGRELCLSVDTAQSTPADIVDPQDQTPFDGRIYPVAARTVVVFEAVAVSNP
jgi:glycogen operon protein